MSRAQQCPRSLTQSAGMALKDYSDFELLVERRDGGYRANVLQSLAGKGATEFDAPFSREDLDLLIPFFSCVSRDVVAQRGRSEEKVFQEAGAKLFQAVFSGQVLNRLELSLAEVKTREMGLRLRLRIANPEAALWPWEYLYDSDSHKWLALLPHVTIVRDPAVGAPVPALPVSPPLRVLVFIASPQGQRALNSTREWTQIERGVRDVRRRGRLLFTRLEHGTLQSLLNMRTVPARTATTVLFLSVLSSPTSLVSTMSLVTSGVGRGGSQAWRRLDLLFAELSFLSDG